MNHVQRVGDLVQRDAGPWTPTVHRFLEHLHARGIPGVPLPVAADAEHELLTFVVGTVPEYPLPEWVWSDGVLDAGARLLRRIHDASLDFDPVDAHWQSPVHEPSEVICHNDFAPHNLVFDDGALVGAIDFDTCSPGPRLWDLAYFATRTIPFSDGGDRREIERRIDVLLSSYGTSADRTELLEIALVRLHDIAEFTSQRASALGKRELLDHVAGYQRDAAFVESLLDRRA
jgi:aminoglycoside phosphotransferase (APT) family kinase protein